MAASRGRLVELGPVQPQMLHRADPDQAIEHGHAKEGDEADRRRDRERHAPHDQGEHAAGGRHGYGEVDQARQPHRVKAAVEQQEDQQHGHGHDDRQPPRGRLEVLELAAPAKAIAGPSRNRGVRSRPGLRPRIRRYRDLGRSPPRKPGAGCSRARPRWALPRGRCRPDPSAVIGRPWGSTIRIEPILSASFRHDAGSRTWSRCLI